MKALKNNFKQNIPHDSCWKNNRFGFKHT